MKKTDLPAKFPIPFAANAGAGYIQPLIPTSSQIGINLGRASLNDGFPPVTMQPIEAGGNPPFGQDENGILFMATSWTRWQNGGGAVYFDNDWAVNSGGYPKDAVIMSAIVPGNMWMSTADDNTNNPDAFGAGWVPHPNMAKTGDTAFTSAPNNIQAGWVAAKNNFTIGAAGSSATFASAMAVFLYVFTWNKYSNAQCPVTGGRGANALADFNALKPIQVFDMAGATPVGNDNGTGRLTGVPVIQGDANTTGSLIGENLHALSSGENGQHSHTGNTSTESVVHTHGVNGTSGAMNQSNPHAHVYDRTTQGPIGSGIFPGGGGIGLSQTATAVSSADINHTHNVNFNSGSESAYHTHPFTSDPSGSGTPHNNVHRSVVGDWMHKL